MGAPTSITSHRPASITAAKRRVDELIQQEGKEFGEVEEYIDALPCSNESKSVLWLLAWAQQDRATQESVLATSLIEATG